MKKRVRKLISCLVIVGIIGTLAIIDSQIALACEVTQGCKGNYSSECISVSSKVEGSHQVGDNTTFKEQCYITITSGTHKISCNGCNKFIKTENRTCSIVHSSNLCTALNRTNMCK